MDLFLSILAKAGYVLAIYLWRSLGPKYYGPMIVVLVADIIGMAWKYLSLPWDTVLTPLIKGGYHILLLFWVVRLSRVFKDNIGYAAAITMLLVFTLQISLIPPLDRTDPRYYINLTTQMMTVLEITIALLIVLVFIWWVSQADYRKGWSKKLKEGKRLMILDHASAVLIPMFIWSALVPAAEYFHEQLPKSLYDLRYLISSYCLGWGWVILYFRAGWERDEVRLELESKSEQLQQKINDSTSNQGEH